MLVKGLLDLVYNLLELILFVELPSLPETLHTVFAVFEEYLCSGISILFSFIGPTGMSVLSLFLNIIISVNLFYMAWSIVFWILRKIPMLGIKE